MRIPALLGVLWLCTSTAVAGTINVPGDYTSIQGAVDACPESDTVLISPGVYRGEANRNIDIIGKSIVVMSTGGAEETIVDCEKLGRAFLVSNYSSGRSVISGLTIRNGDSAAGGGMRIQEAAADIYNCFFENNSAPHGGALYINTPKGDINFVGCRFSGNVADGLPRAMLVEKADTVSETGALPGAFGGVIYGQYAGNYINFVDCSFYGNVADHGGAISFVNYLYATITGCTFAANICSDGSIVEGRISVIERCIVAFNEALSPVDGSLGPTVSCTDVFGNEGGDWVGPLASWEEINDNFSEDPAFCGLEPNGLNLEAFSPCLAALSPCGMRVGAFDVGACSANLPTAWNLALVDEVSSRVVNQTPTWAWSYRDNPVGEQVSYEIEVGSDDDWSTAELWATGPVVSLDSSVVYAGVPLEDGETYYMRLRVFNGVAWGGWLESTFRMNAVPGAPAQLGPPDGEAFQREDVILTVGEVVEPDGDPVTYGVEVYDDPACTNVITSFEGTSSINGECAIGPMEDLDFATEYWWRTRASDGYEYSPWSAASSFVTTEAVVRRVPSEFRTIQAAIDASHNMDTVLVAAGIYIGTGNCNLLIAGKAINLISEAGAASTTIHCTHDGRGIWVYEFEGDASVISGFTVFDGSSSAGGGIRIEKASALVEDCVFEECVAPHGGAVYINTPSETPRFTGCRFMYNTAGGGRPTDVEVNDTTDSQPSLPADGMGGAVYLQYGDFVADFAHCVFVGNIADYGTLASSKDAIYNVSRCTFVGNTCISGSALYSTETGANVTTSIMASNYGADVVYCNYSLPTITCCDMFDNDEGDWINCIAGQNGVNGNFSVDPLFVDPENDDYTILTISPCAASNNTCAETIGAIDPDGVSSLYPVAVDINLGDEYYQRVVSPNPVFYWTIADETPVTQVAYEAQVGTDHDWTTAEMWATGQVYSNLEQCTYEGAELVDGVTYVFRVRLYDGSSWGAWRTFTFRMNAVAYRPEILSPPVGALINYVRGILVARVSPDPDGEPQTYDVQMFTDESLTELYLEFTSLDTPSDQLELGPVALDIGRTYWWRARAHDEYEPGPWSTTAWFNTRDVGQVKVPLEYSTITEALFSCGEGDTVLVDAGNYHEHLVFDDRSILLRSSDGADRTFIISSLYAFPMLDFKGGMGNRSRVEGFTIKGARSASGIVIGSGNAVTVRDCVLTDNHGKDGAGIRCYGDNSVIYGCSFTYNTCNVYDYSGVGDPADVVFDSAYDTGDPDDVTPYDEGGGVFIAADNVVVDSCFFAHNNAYSGSAGAIYSRYSDGVRITRNVGYDNRSSGQGTGFMYAYVCDNLEITNNTLVENETDYRGSALTLWDDHDVTIANNVMAFNVGGEAVWAHGSSFLACDCNLTYDNVMGDYLGVIPDANCVSADPYFCGYRSGAVDFRVYPESPCMPANNSCGEMIGARGESSDCTDYLCGDADGNHQLDANDVAFLYACYFSHGPLPQPLNAGDPNCDNVIAVDDVMYLVAYLRGTGAMPCCGYGDMLEVFGAPTTPVVHMPTLESRETESTTTVDSAPEVDEHTAVRQEIERKASLKRERRK